MKMMIIPILLLVISGMVFGAEQDDTESWISDWNCLISTESFGRWDIDQPILDSTSIDAALSVEVLYPGVRLAATTSFSGDSTGSVGLRSAFAGLRFPGTPWIGIEGFYHAYTPFVFGLHAPIIEWDRMDIEDLRGAGLSAGGILGFSGICRIIQDNEGVAITDILIESPWFGFVDFEYRRLHIYLNSDLKSEKTEYLLNLLIIDSNLRYLKPYVIIMSSDIADDADWGLLAEIRGIEPFSTGLGDAVLVPSIEFAGSEWRSEENGLVPGQQTLRLDLLIEPQKTMTSFGISGMYDLKVDSLSGGALKASMITEADIRYSLNGSYFTSDRWNVGFGLQYRNMGSAAGCVLGFYPDSTRITATAGYTPRNDVSCRLEVSGDAVGSPNPLCRLSTIAVIGPVDGIFGIDWDGECVEYRIEVRGLIE